MLSISNMKVGSRLGFGFGLVLLPLIGITFLGITRLSTLNDGTQLIVNDRFAKANLAYTVIANVKEIGNSMRDAVLFADPDVVRKQLSEIESLRVKIKDALDKMEKLLSTEKGKDLFRAVAEARSKYVALQVELQKSIGEGKKEDAKNVLLTKLPPVEHAYIASLDALIAFMGGLIEKAGKDAADDYQSARNLMLGLAGLAMLLATGIAFWATRSITRPLNEAVSVAQKVAAGDLTSVVEVTTKDETGLLLQALKDMNQNLAQIVGDVRGGTDSITTASKEIAAGNTDLSQRTEEQASSLEETASSMEQLTSTVKQNAENAKQANQLAAGASDVAIKGGAVVSQVVTTMSSINESSKKIVDIISVIDGIAFQTNILALNAAVEAARAGEQGRGFAVVASEVRTLAQRSAAAAKEIKDLISDSVHRVEEGTVLVDEAGKTMDEVVSSVKRVNDIMAEITAASQEQSEGIGQVNTAVTQMDEVTQQNAALVEEAAAAAESLQEQAENLTRAVSVFKLPNAQQGMSAMASAPKAVVRQLAPRTKTKPRAPVKLAVANPPRASAKTGTDDEWTEF